MNTQKLTIEEAKQKLNNGFGSIYSREDVIALLDSIVMPEQKPSADVEEILQKVKQVIRDKFYNVDKEDLIDDDSAEFSIGYNNRVELDSIDLDLDSFRDEIESAVFEEVRQMLDEKAEQYEIDAESSESEE